MSRRSLVLPVAAALALLTWAGPRTPGARAADTVTIALDPGVVELSLTPQENIGATPIAVPVPDHSFRYVPARYGGAVTVQIPPQMVDTGQVAAMLALQKGDDAQSRTYSTDPATPPENRLVMTALGGNRYRVQLPADDGVNGPVARLHVLGLQLRPGIDVILLDPVGYQLQLSATGPASVQLGQQAVAVGCPPDQPYAGGCGPIDRVTAGTRIRVMLPRDSRLRQVGLTGLADSAFGFTPNSSQWPRQGPATALTASVSSDGATAAMTVPAGMTPGAYQFTAVVGDTGARLVTLTGFRVDVVASPATSAPSSTGVAPSTGATTSAGAAPAGNDEGSSGPNLAGLWVALGAVGVLAAGSAVAVVQCRHHHPHRHRPA